MKRLQKSGVSNAKDWSRTEMQTSRKSATVSSRFRAKDLRPLTARRWKSLGLDPEKMFWQLVGIQNPPRNGGPKPDDKVQRAHKIVIWLARVAGALTVGRGAGRSKRISCRANEIVEFAFRRVGDNASYEDLSICLADIVLELLPSELKPAGRDGSFRKGIVGRAMYPEPREVTKTALGMKREHPGRLDKQLVLTALEKLAPEQKLDQHQISYYIRQFSSLKNR